jgi:hypothetical protein
VATEERLPVEQVRIMNQRLDAALGEVRAERVAPRVLQNIQVIDVRAGLARIGEHYAFAQA